MVNWERWSNPNELENRGWLPRAEMAAQWIPEGSVVLDLECGSMSLEKMLPAQCTYTPCDVVERDHSVGRYLRESI